MNQVIFPLLRPKRNFRKIAHFDSVDFYWCPGEKVIFLIPKAVNDFSALIELAKEINSSNGEFNAQKRLKDNDAENALLTLFLFRVRKLISKNFSQITKNLDVAKICFSENFRTLILAIG